MDKTYAQLLAIANDAIAGTYRMRVYVDGLVSVHLQDYNATVPSNEEIPETVDLPLSIATAYKFGFTPYNLLQGVLSTDNGGLNIQRPKQFQEYQLVRNTDLETPLTNEFFLSTINLEFIKCASGGGGNNVQQPGLFISGGRVSYIGNDALTPVVTSVFGIGNNIASAALGGSNAVLQINFTSPITEIWGISVSQLDAGSISGGQKSANITYNSFPTFGVGGITGITMFISKQIIPNLKFYAIVQGGGADEDAVLYRASRYSYEDATTPAAIGLDVKTRSTDNIEENGRDWNINSGSLIRVAHRNGIVTAGFRPAEFEFQDPGQPEDDDVEVEIGSGPFLQYVTTIPDPTLKTDSISYFISSLGPAGDSSFVFNFMGNDLISSTVQGNEVFALDIIIAGNIV